MYTPNHLALCLTLSRGVVRLPPRLGERIQMPIRKVKQIVSTNGIRLEIEKTSKKLSLLEKDAEPSEREAIDRQMLQLDVCKRLLHDFFIIP